MEDAELVGGVLLGAADPKRAAHHLTALLLTPDSDPLKASQFGLDPELVEVLHARMDGDKERIIAAATTVQPGYWDVDRSQQMRHGNS